MQVGNMETCIVGTITHHQPIEQTQFLLELEVLMNTYGVIKLDISFDPYKFIQKYPMANIVFDANQEQQSHRKGMPMRCIECGEDHEGDCDAAEFTTRLITQYLDYLDMEWLALTDEDEMEELARSPNDNFLKGDEKWKKIADEVIEDNVEMSVGEGFAVH